MFEKTDTKFDYKAYLLELCLADVEPNLSVPRGHRQYRLGSMEYKRGPEEAVSNRAWTPIRKFRDQVESMEEERVVDLFDKIFWQTLDPESLGGLTQEEITEQFTRGSIPEGMDFLELTEMIENASVLEDDF